MDEQHYLELARQAFERMLEAYDQLDPDDAEAEPAGDVITITFGSGQRAVVNTQRPARQIWLAGGDSAWHFSYDAAQGRWLDDKGRGELFEVLRTITREASGLEVNF